MPFRKKRHNIQEDEILVIEFDRGEGREKIRTTVQSVTDDAAKILAPLRQGIPVLLPKGLQMKASLLRDDALYLFDTVIIEREAGNVPVLVIPLPVNLQRVQRRGSYRLPTEIPLELIIPAGDAALTRQRLSRDLSGNGLRVAGENLPTGMIVHVKIQLPNRGSPIFAIAEVVRNEPDYKAANAEHCIGLKFVELAAHDREAITRYVVAESGQRSRERG